MFTFYLNMIKYRTKWRLLMSNDNMFQINFKGKSINIPKENAHFQNGYAVIEKTIVSEAKEYDLWYPYNLKLMGVVDENYDTVVDFKGWNQDIQIFPEGNIIVKVSISGGDGEQSYIRYENRHYKINGKQTKIVDKLDFSEYERINNTTIKVKIRNYHEYFDVLYDVVDGKFISEKFTSIGNFEKQNEEIQLKLAKAIMRLPYNDGTRNVCEIVCYIDESGTIRSSLYNSHTNSMIETTTNEFNFSQTVELIQKQILKDNAKKTIRENQLIKSISVPK